MLGHGAISESPISSFPDAPITFVSGGLTSRLGGTRSRFANFTPGLGGDFDANIAEETIIFSSTANFSIALQRLRLETAANTIVFVNEVIRLIVKTITQSLALSQTLSFNKISTRTVNHSLVFNQTIAKTMMFVRTAANELVFQSFFTRYLGSKSVNVPQAQATKTNSIVLLQTPGAAIVLPTPILGDTQVNSSLKVDVKYGITGGIRTYIKVTELQKLRYSFILGRRKSLELRAFINAANSTVITLTNWKGEVWFVNLVNSPFELIAKSRWVNDGERVDVTLEFEGIKIGG